MIPPARATPALLPLVLCASAAGVALAVLVWARPDLGPGAWASGDALARAAAWTVAAAAGAWLFAVTGVCGVAVCLRRPGVAHRLLPGLPPAVRRMVEVAIVAACVAVPALPASAATPASPTTAASAADQPVVRTPAPALAAPTTPAVTTPAVTTPAGGTPVAGTPAPPVSSGHVVVRPGDNLWSIARQAVARASGRRPSDAETARYWHAVIDVNRATLRSGVPSLIFPGEIVTLPPLRVVS